MAERDGAEALFEEAPCGYLVGRPDGIIERVNRTFLRWTGFDRAALLSGRRFQDLLTVPGRIYYETHIAPLLRVRGEVREVALDLLLDGGRALPVLVNAAQPTDEDGQPAAIRIAVMEATDRRRYERELLLARRRAEQLAAVVNASGDAILLMAPDGTIQSWNRGAEQLFGHSAEEAVGLDARTLLVPPDRLEEYDRTAGEVRAGREVRLETVWIDRAGRRIDVSLSLTPHIEALDEVVAVSSIIRDITERRRIDAELRQAAQLHAVGTLAGGVAHEINNQMTVVLGLGDFVRRGLGAEHPQTADVEGMIAAGARAAHVTQQLLAFGRRQVMSPEHVDVHRLAGDLAPVLARLLGRDKSLVLEADRPGATVRADVAQLEQILINLVANARDALEPGGRVTIATRDARLTPADAHARPADDVVPGPYVLITVSDTGRGMDPATLARAFEPFFTTKPIGEGTGLGLSTVHGIVKQHGGQVWLESEPGRGTTVRVYLPAVVAPVKAPIEARPPADATGSAKRSSAAVLIVEDEPGVRVLARRSLEAAGLSVLEAESGRHAWDLLAVSAGPPELVLADLMMPDMDGRELGEAIGRQWPEVPVLYTSAYPGSDVLAQGILPTDAHFLQKPFTPDELVDRVSEILRQTRTATLQVDR